MADREQLKSLIDQLPDASLEMVRTMMNLHIHPPPPPPPEVEQMLRRGQEYRKRVEQQFNETLKPGTLGGRGSGGGGGRFSGVHEGMPYAYNSFHYWDGNALVRQTLQSFDTQDIEIMQRFSFTADGTEFECVVELSSGGRTVRHEERFPRTKR